MCVSTDKTGRVARARVRCFDLSAKFRKIICPLKFGQFQIEKGTAIQYIYQSILSTHKIVLHLMVDSTLIDKLNHDFRRRPLTLVIRRKSSIFADKTKLIYGSKKETAPTSRKNSNH